VRLFKDVREKSEALMEANAQLTQALEQQTATSLVLQVGSMSGDGKRGVARVNGLFSSPGRACRRC
jgi:hypothetical protein